MGKLSLFEYIASDLPPESSSNVLKRFGYSDSYPAKITSEEIEIPHWNIVSYSFRRRRWENMDAERVQVINWYSEKEVGNG
jgi:hypothetical protein